MTDGTVDVKFQGLKRCVSFVGVHPDSPILASLPIPSRPRFGSHTELWTRASSLSNLLVRSLQECRRNIADRLPASTAQEQRLSRHSPTDLSSPSLVRSSCLSLQQHLSSINPQAHGWGRRAAASGIYIHSGNISSISAGRTTRRTYIYTRADTHTTLSLCCLCCSRSLCVQDYCSHKARTTPLQLSQPTALCSLAWYHLIAVGLVACLLATRAAPRLFSPITQGLFHRDFAPLAKLHKQKKKRYRSASYKTFLFIIPNLACTQNKV
ncbi:hypothetical protein V8F20_000652 [Naviculisporaceae sp. PSN 640]